MPLISAEQKVSAQNAKTQVQTLIKTYELPYTRVTLMGMGLRVLTADLLPSYTAYNEPAVPGVI